MRPFGMAPWLLGWCLVAAHGAAQPPAFDLKDELARRDLEALRDSLTLRLRKALPDAIQARIRVSDSETARQIDAWRLLTVFSPAEIAQIRAEEGGAAFLGWLGDHPAALEEYLSSGQPEEYRASGLKIWRQIWIAHPESREGPLLRLAEATALVFALPLGNMADGKLVDGLKRYSFFADSYRRKQLFPSFETARAWELRYVVDSWAPDEDLEWVRGKVAPNLRNANDIGEACWMVPYRDKNAKGVSVQEGSKYYDYKPMTLQLMTEVGGVCGAISRFGVSAAQAFGVPAMPVGQPGHCAHFWRNRDGSWRMGQDIFGWPQSSQHDGIRVLWGARPTHVFLVDTAMANPASFATSQRLWWASKLWERDRPATRIGFLRAAFDADRQNLPVAREYLGLAQKLYGPDRQAAILRDAFVAVRDTPYVVADLYRDYGGSLLTSIPSDAKAVGLLQDALVAIASGDPARQGGCGSWAVSDVVGHAIARSGSAATGWAVPLRSGKDDGDLWKRLPEADRVVWWRAMETALRATAARQDLYGAPLGLYADVLRKDPTAQPHGLAALGGIARQAIARKTLPFALDVATKLDALCEASGDKAGAAEWRKARADLGGK